MIKTEDFIAGIFAGLIMVCGIWKMGELMIFMFNRIFG